MSALDRLLFSSYSCSRQYTVMKENSNYLSSRELGLFAVFGVISLQIVVVRSYPMGIEGRSFGIHQKQPSYLPAYNGIFSIHALNFTQAAFDKSENNYQMGSQETTISNAAFNASSEQLIGGNQSLPPSQEVDLNLLSGADSNEVDSKNDHQDESLLGPSTFPQIQVITKTITGETFQTSSTSTTNDNVSNVSSESTSTTGHSTDGVLKLVASNSSETLLAGPGEDPVEANGGEEDIFDHLMKRIQSHWLEFVGKMKLSVLDVWKSISQHMMERLESFASAL